MNKSLLAVSAAAFFLVCGSQAPAAVSDEVRASLANIDGQRIINAPQAEPGNWLTHGRSYAEDRHSTLDQIDRDNVQQLGLEWIYETGTERGLQATPIVVDGVMYTTGPWSLVFALDARTGEELWRYDPEVPKAWGSNACCDVVNRGVAVWQGRVYAGTIDGRLIALDAATGEPHFDVNTIDRTKPYTITHAPRIVDGKVIVGNGGAEYGVRGYVSAYDADSGEKLWRFWTVPGDPAAGFEDDAMAMAAETWTGEWWKFGGGGTVWDSMAYDPELDLLYIGVGNGTPWNRDIRSPEGGDNLFLSSMVALRPDTGEYVWHYQTTPAETWDYTAAQHMILADLEIDGEIRKTIMQAPKNGFFYVIDRETGEFISAENYVAVNWATHVDPETGRPVETETQYEDEPKLTRPSPLGGHNWQPMSFHPGTGLVYIPAMDLPFLYSQPEVFEFAEGRWNVGVDMNLGGAPPVKNQILARKLAREMAIGYLLAWDPVAQKEAWKVRLPTHWNGGVLSTAGDLVFQGTGDARFVAYDAHTGEELWAFATQSGVIAAPVTWELDGVQYVTVNVGWGGAGALAGGDAVKFGNLHTRGRVLTFRLNADGTLPPAPEQPRIPEPPKVSADSDTVQEGRRLYHEYCAVCHGPGAVSGSSIPDLRYMDEVTHESWQGIVIGGAYKGRGMVPFSDLLDMDDSDAIHQYVIHRANESYRLQESPGWWRGVREWFYGVVAKVVSWFF